MHIRAIVKVYCGLAIVFLLASCRDKAEDESANGGSLPSPTQRQNTKQLTTNWPISRQEAESLQSKEAQRLGIPGISRLDLGSGVSIELVLVPGGTFPMGSVSYETTPQRIVKISKPFLMGRYEVTWSQFLAVVDMPDMDFASQQHVNDTVLAHQMAAYPAEVHWLLAEKFCEKLSAAQGVKARLPTEAEWEYACRAGTVAPYGEWDRIDDSKACIGWWVEPDGAYRYASEKNGNWGLVEGGRYAPNRWGIHDMMGNATEWCLDAFSSRSEIAPTSVSDPVVGDSRSVFRVVRGGSYLSAATVFERSPDATTATGRGIRLVIEYDSKIKEKLTAGDPG